MTRFLSEPKHTMSCSCSISSFHASRAILDVADNRMTSDPGSRYFADPAHVREEDVQNVGGRM